MKSKQFWVLVWLIAFAPLALVLICMPWLPEQIPVQWGLDGNIRYGAVTELLFIAGLSPVILALLRSAPKMDPRKKNYLSFQKYYDGFALALTIFLLLMVCIVLSESFWPGRITIYKALGLLMGLLFMFLGNMMGKVKSNFFMGFRTPWALEDPDIWNRTQRLGGQVFFFSGLGSILFSLLLPEFYFFLFLLVSVLGGVAFTFLMSWYWYRQKHAVPNN